MTRLDLVIDLMQAHDVSRVVLLSYVMGPLVTPEFRDFPGAIGVNVVGVTNVFEAARLCGIKRLVMASTVGVYGPQQLYGDRPVTEDDLAAPRSVYGRMKALNEAVGARYAAHYDLEVITVRPSSILGPRSTIWPSRLLEPVALGKPGVAPYGPEARDNVIAVSDLADLLGQLTLRERLQHDTYLAAGQNITMEEFVGLLSDLVPDAAITYREGGTAPTYAQVFDNTRIRQELDWTPSSLRDVVSREIETIRRESQHA